jgi:hypothetical protein
MNLPPKYSQGQLLSILNTEPSLPDSISEQNFRSDIRDNEKIKWRVNPYLRRQRLLLVLLDTETFRKWKIVISLNWIIALAIIGFAIWKKDYKILLFLAMYPYFIVTVDHWIFVVNVIAVITLRALFSINIPYFWFFVMAILGGYALNKAISEMIDNKILRQALGDLVTFWRYYSNKMIWIDKWALNDEYQKLTQKYPPLLD